jgi:hypothetical protein
MSRLAVAAIIALAGCGGPALPTLHPVRGTVFLPDGKPATGGTVAFVAKDGGPQPVTVDAPIRRDGTFEVMAPAGAYTVAVSPRTPFDSGDDLAMLKAMPKVYQDHKTSPLTTEVPAASSLDLRLIVPEAKK